MMPVVQVCLLIQGFNAPRLASFYYLVTRCYKIVSISHYVKNQGVETENKKLKDNHQVELF